MRAHVIISGMVQGVCYRYFAIEEAEKLGLAGWVKNLPTGQVEAEIEGDRSAVEALIKSLKIGPRAAHVTDTKIEWIEPKGEAGEFRIRY
ncbi:MAG: acylphosphatase [Calditrichaeota bacterium]|nr:acylphosphatase [Calditrichota bacterium]